MPRLQHLGHEIVVVSRQPEQTRRLFGAVTTGSLNDFQNLCEGVDMVVHLAVANNERTHTPATYQEVNVDLTLRLVEQSRDAGVPVFVNISTWQALNENPKTPYARSKRKANEAVQKLTGIRIATVFLPLVHASPDVRSTEPRLPKTNWRSWTGSTRFLNAMPLGMGAGIFSVLSAFKPTVHVNHLAYWIHQGALAQIDGWTILTDGQVHNRLYQFMRRCLDYLAIVFATVVLWWLYISVWLLVRLSSPGPGLFSQTRVGKNGKHFTCYKFRTMRTDTPNVATHRVDQASVTAVGKVLRRTKVDELPQLWNVGRGEMTLVGPRPCLPNQTELIEERQKHDLYSVAPGITGYAQVHNVNMEDIKKLAKYDLFGLSFASIASDVSIILRTIIRIG